MKKLISMISYFTISIFTISILLFGCVTVDQSGKIATVMPPPGIIPASPAELARFLSIPLRDGESKSIAIGLTLGAAAMFLEGVVVENYTQTKIKNATETAKDEKYKPKQGMRIEVKEVNVAPGDIKKGGNTKVSMTYSVLTPNSSKEIDIKEKFFVKAKDQSVPVGKPVNVKRDNGTFGAAEDTRNFQVMGKYVLRAEVEAEGKTSSKEVNFQVVASGKGSGQVYVMLTE